MAEPASLPSARLLYGKEDTVSEEYRQQLLNMDTSSALYWQWRRRHNDGKLTVGASEAQDALGTPLAQLCLAKKKAGLVNSEFSSAATEHGKKYEAVALKAYITHNPASVVRRTGVYMRQDVPWIHATPDSAVVEWAGHTASLTALMEEPRVRWYPTVALRVVFAGRIADLESPAQSNNTTVNMKDGGLTIQGLIEVKCPYSGKLYSHCTQTKPPKPDHRHGAPFEHYYQVSRVAVIYYMPMNPE